MNVYSYVYSNAYSPAAPVVEISVYSPSTVANQARLTLMLDTGSDVTTLPIRVLKRIGAEYLQTATLYGIAGGRNIVDLYRVAIQLGPHNIPAVRVAGVVSITNALLGRDVLNHLVVTLDGPAQMLEIAE